MSTLAELRAGIVDRLTAAGLRATADPRNINPPCVVVEMAQGARVTACAYEGTVDVVVVSSGAGHADAAGWLDGTASTVARLLVAATMSPDTYAVTGQPGPLLAYRLTIPATWEAT